MAIRLTIDGVNVECDTPLEASAMIQSAKSGNEIARTRMVPRNEPNPGVNRGHAEKVHVPGLFKPNELGEHRIFKGMPLAALTAMKESYPNGVSSNQLAARIGRSRRSIPIILVAIQKYAEGKHLRFDDVITRQKPPKGEKGSSYSLTPRGLKELF